MKKKKTWGFLAAGGKKHAVFGKGWETINNGGRRAPRGNQKATFAGSDPRRAETVHAAIDNGPGRNWEKLEDTEEDLRRPQNRSQNG